MVGAPDWDQLVSASLAYNRAAPSRLTLWDFTGGTFPEVDAVLARFVADRVAPHLSDASDRKVAMLALGDHEFAQLRVYASWAEIHLQASIRMQFRPFRSVGPAIDWLLSP
ncbi:MAG: hypothetical protein V2J02_20295 [Pseudomonadales bacterium]|nr:hypothetical protein [Pseudomonadales bacterium]